MITTLSCRLFRKSLFFGRLKNGWLPLPRPANRSRSQVSRLSLPYCNPFLFHGQTATRPGHAAGPYWKPATCDKSCPARTFLSFVRAQSRCPSGKPRRTLPQERRISPVCSPVFRHAFLSCGFTPETGDETGLFKVRCRRGTLKAFRLQIRLPFPRRGSPNRKGRPAGKNDSGRGNPGSVHS